MQITVYSYTYDTDKGIGTMLYATKVERDNALRDALMSYLPEEKRLPSFAKLDVETFAIVVSALRPNENVSFNWESHTLDITVFTV
jgi:hypothetical protein